ncbi:hypothetical protein F511_40692 [Dorcoceras hygrometricum]|uniref:PUM-HD domain-containing protein n=1 Tax=Dorcoceras hygrometricum TaxID=472368 RepID=A0A2Z7BL23_9LAMI|nr:hypothetical protein F511_40692 [Dorcoceras hygrometricum]
MGAKTVKEHYPRLRAWEPQKSAQLLETIAGNAKFLSNDPYGNYVVQQAMVYGDDRLMAMIFQSLCGHFTQLSQEKGGSHVVEKCVNSSRVGTEIIVEEILLTPSAPFRLSRHQYGNYVIQAALKNLKIQENETLYLLLAQALEPHFPELQCNAGGREIVNLIIGDL